MNKESLFPTRQIDGWIAATLAHVQRNVPRFLTALLFCAWSATAGTAAPTVTVTSQTRNIIALGQGINLSVTATGSGSVTYQWLCKGKVLAGGTSASLAIANATYADSGWYLVDVTDGTGVTRSASIFVYVTPAVTQVRAWGSTGYGQANVPAGLSDVLAVSAGGSHSLALKRDGTVVAWGYNGNGQTTVPAGLADVVAISAGANNSMALKSDGTVVAWGQNQFGQCDVPAGLSGVVALAAGTYHTLALKNDGTVVGWGANFSGSLSIPLGLSGIIAISAGDNFSLALKNDGTAVGWGENTYGQAGIGSGLTGVRAIDAGAFHSLVLLDSGLVMGAGYGAYVQVTPPAGLTAVTAVSAGAYHSLAIRSDRTVAAWGNYHIGESNPPEGLTDVIAISASESGGYLFSLALRDASNDAAPVVVTPPASQSGVEGQAATLTVTASGPGPFTYQWRKDGGNLTGANAASLALTNLQLADAGSYDVVVTNYVGSVTSAAAMLAINPIPVVTSLAPRRIVLTPGQDLNLAVTATGTSVLSYQWTRNGRLISGETNNSFSLVGVTNEDSGCYAVLVTDNIGTRRSDSFFVNVAPAFTKVRMWGDNRYGQSINQVGLNDCIAVEGGTAHALALRRDGTVVGWGYEGYGQSVIPAGLTDVVAIADGNDHSLALKNNGTVVAWGQNYFGQASVPVGLADVVAIAVGDRCSFALKSDGTVVGWGFDSGGQWRVPAGLNDVVAITAGSIHFYAVKKDGTVVAWGQNSYGELSVPAGLSGVVSVVTTTYDSLALKNDGTVVGWGIGISNATSISGGLTDVIAIAGGANHFMALKHDGTVVAWSQDYLFGQAVVPTGMTGCVGLGAGDNQSLVVRDAASDPEPTITVQPLSQTVVEGNSVTFFAAAIGIPAPSYQWKKNGTDIPGATSSSYTITNAVAGSAGSYTVIATNSAGSDTSTVASLAFIVAVAPSNAVITIAVE